MHYIQNTNDSLEIEGKRFKVRNMQNQSLHLGIWPNKLKFYGAWEVGLGHCNFHLPIKIIIILGKHNFASNMARMKNSLSNFPSFFHNICWAEA
jgi:hypothetical protein